jgi:hypothetical protein
MVYGDYDDENVKTLRRYRDGCDVKEFFRSVFYPFLLCYISSPCKDIGQGMCTSMILLEIY